MRLVDVGGSENPLPWLWLSSFC